MKIKELKPHKSGYVRAVLTKNKVKNHYYSKKAHS
jgi:hypothetical protein